MFEKFDNENDIISNIAMMIWKNRREKNDLIQDLNIQVVEELSKLNIAKGLKITNTKTIIYLRANVNTKLIKPTLENDLTIPENENISVASGIQKREVFNSFKNSEKLIVF